MWADGLNRSRDYGLTAHSRAAFNALNVIVKHNFHMEKMNGRLYSIGQKCSTLERRGDEEQHSK